MRRTEAQPDHYYSGVQAREKHMASEWIVLLEAAREPSSRAVDREMLSRLLDALRHAQPLGLHSPDRYALQFHVAAPTPTEALASALSAWSDALTTAVIPAWELVRAEVTTPEELDYEMMLAGAGDGFGVGLPRPAVNMACAEAVAGMTTEQGPLAGWAVNCDRRWRLILGGSREMLMVLSAEGKVLYSMACADGKRSAAEESIGRAFADQVHPDDARPGCARRGGRLSSRAHLFRCSLSSARRVVLVRVRSQEPSLDEPLVAAIVVNSRDVTESKRLEERLAEMAERDELTGLLNRTVFVDQLELALARSEVASHTAVFFVDIIDFRGFVERHGRAVGNQLLLSVAERLSTAVYDRATAARLGGDEFGLLCEDVASSTEAAEIAKRIVTVVGAPIALGADQFEASVTIGVALGTSAMLQPATLLRHAEVAMYRARRGQARYDFYRKQCQPRSSSDAPPS